MLVIVPGGLELAGSDNNLGLYLHLARASEMRRRPFVRDKLLVLAGDQAVDMGLEQIADYCRHKILKHNPGHLLRRFSSFAGARHDESFQSQLIQIRRAYPQERVEHMLETLGIHIGRERETYFTDHEYAASLLGTTPEELEAMFGDHATGQSGSESERREPNTEDHNPYRSPAASKTDARFSVARLFGRFPLPFGLIVVLLIAIPVIMGVGLALLISLLRLLRQW